MRSNFPNCTMNGALIGARISPQGIVIGADFGGIVGLFFKINYIKQANFIR